MRAGTMYRTELFSRIGVRATGGRVLDIGSFDGLWLAQQDAVTRVGIDIDIQPNADNNVIRGDGLRLPFADGVFDGVFAFDVIEHVDDDQLFVSELVRVTRPGGTVTITTPSADLRIFPSRLTKWAHRRWGHDQCTGYRAERLRSLFEQAGSDNVEIKYLRSWAFLNFYLPLSLLSRVSNRLSRAAFGVAAALDSRWRREGPHGYLLATVKAQDR